jgi:2-oxoacid:acceptor oxidoreductase, delta subunit, pyruvate/2-ketoisovalerate family
MMPLSDPRVGAAGKTGKWRTLRPELDKEKCTNCLLCWMYCPEGAIDRVEDGVCIDYEYCKGCGICAEECARKAIVMVEEKGGD